MHRILIAGFQHETNTFAPTPAGYDNFVCGEAFPALCRGEALLALRDVNVPLGGFLSAFDADEASFVSVIWAGASPSAHVTRDAFERIAGEIVEAAGRGGFDAIYLDLHGAMMVEHLDDGEGELLRRVREAVGPALPIVASLDLHANVTEAMLTAADLLTAYREYPHADMAATGARAAELLRRLLATPDGWLQRHLALPFLIPVNGGCTWLEPARSTYAYLTELEREHEVALSFAPGFPMADFPGCRPCVWGYAHDERVLTEALSALYRHIVEREGDWGVDALSPEAAVREAMRLAAGRQQPVMIADTQDNPGAGGDGDTMGMLKALVAARAENAAIGLIWDPTAVAAAHAAGEGAEIELALGGRSGAAGDSPLVARFTVEYVAHGRCRFAGPMFHGMTVDFGLVVRLRLGGVQIAVSSVKSQMLERNLYRMVGIDPERKAILVNKSSVHFRADFAPIAAAILVAQAPGPCPVDPASLPWRRLGDGIRLGPLGKPYHAVP